MERSMSGEFTRGSIPGPMLEVTVLAAEDLKNVNICRRMSVYAVAWVTADYKGTTSVRRRAGRNPVWNDTLFFPVNDDILLHPHSALTVQVYSTGTVTPSLVGITHLALTDIARMKATKTNSEEGDIVFLPLHRPSGRTQGIISLCVNLMGATIQQMMYALDKGQDGWAIEMPTIFSGAPDVVAVMGYPAVQPYRIPAPNFYPSYTSCAEPSTEGDAVMPTPARLPPRVPYPSPYFSNNASEDPLLSRNQYVQV
ncbi:uncharacterized protein [Physcomitrium patens]|uniref:C2 domain-containing protein n=1 Tax=Physcomitrium patens TaxID=3218 RepID=A0A2K1KMT2_PHYPA|nr:uncharacterized protein LOC112281666 [Physcomitrium patens]XP_024374208.1 uncharacterized protein LOC112281666 [Physcomitrium patens]XP_024374209.1 uncharacterized protein LOC112281666 [Physcomitrium patens]XP_024374210.1 uncharacterized protein LOC112281666 [Physcomitrium patens]XP_024374211.1 uncharacterized protein LOC112281666 [Physcomitrium patens]PNR55084.1 hypothetical protein PHYPA_005977 [Physcomitrium patens]|eukprot:XP_024374207.1 uncharacterized protein LOC112281666 [Physcomitrella patens]